MNGGGQRDGISFGKGHGRRSSKFETRNSKQTRNSKFEITLKYEIRCLNFAFGFRTCFEFRHSGCGFGSWKRFQKTQQHILTALERVQFDPLVRRVALSDVARTEHNTGNSAARKNGGVAEVVDAGGFALADAAQKLRDQRQLWICFHRFAGCETAPIKGHLQPTFAKEGMYLSFDFSFRFARKCAAIDKNFATVGNDVGLGST